MLCERDVLDAFGFGMFELCAIFAFSLDLKRFKSNFDFGSLKAEAVV